MYNAEESRTRVRLVNMRDDVPEHISGVLIPHAYVAKACGDTQHSTETQPQATLLFLEVWRQVKTNRLYVAVSVVLLLFMFTLGSVTQWATGGAHTMAAPIVYVAADDLPEPTPLHYGVQSALSDDDFYRDVKASFVRDSLSFVAVDLVTMRLSYYHEGMEVMSVPVESTGKEGTWWDMPSGLYEVQEKQERRYSPLENVYLPFSVAFEGNFIIHGEVEQAEGVFADTVPESVGIHLSNGDSESLYRLVSVGTPVLVHTTTTQTDDFVYEPKVSEVSARQYLVADIQNNSVLAASDLNAVVPIASLTKLMTALVAAEQIDLDQDVYISQEKYVTTLIPRLQGRYRTSMYSLLQLLLVESSNEAAEVIAAQVGRDKFIGRMNERALELGLSNTTFTDPSGLDDRNVSSVGDLFKFVSYIQRNRNFILELTYNQNLPTIHEGSVFGELTNFNLIEGVDNFIGGKVGETEAAGQTSISLHKLDINGEERTLVMIILGSEGRTDDVLQLLSYVEEQFVR
jgi:D-alanyl-D-alanine carboxypeptidase